MDRVFGYLALSLLACGKDTPKQLAPIASVAASAPEAHEVVPKRYVSSRATFRDDILSTCEETEIVSIPRLDAGPDWDPLAASRAAAAKDAKSMVLTKSCADQFSDRTPLAKCILGDLPGVDAGKLPRTTSTIYYYVFEAVADDHTMRTCVGKGDGSWVAATRDSPAYRDAKLDYELKKRR